MCDRTGGVKGARHLVWRRPGWGVGRPCRALSRSRREAHDTFCDWLSDTCHFEEEGSGKVGKTNTPALTQTVPLLTDKHIQGGQSV